MGQPCKTGKDIFLNMCIDFDRAGTLPSEGSGEQPKQMLWEHQQ